MEKGRGDNKEDHVGGNGKRGEERVRVQVWSGRERERVGEGKRRESLKSGIIKVIIKILCKLI